MKFLRWGRDSSAPAASGSAPATDPFELPMPPLELRTMVGVTDPADFDNPSGGPVFADMNVAVPEQRLYASVFDFGCGCGRQARQLMQMQRPPPEYVGVEPSRKLVQWCQANLRRPGFQFHHHDVYNSYYAPENSRVKMRPLEFKRDHYTIVNAHSVFTHLVFDQANFYLRQLALLTAPDGVIRTSWFFFNRAMIPVLAENQFCLFINDVHPTQAVYFDWGWFTRYIAQLGLFVAFVRWPHTRGFQNLVVLTKDRSLALDADSIRPSPNVLGF
jgi:SAM-dependent methyltransferase